MAKKKIVKPFRVGDVVKKVKKTSWFCKLGVEHIIVKTEFSQGDWEYVTDHSAWHDHSSFELVREADEKSLRKVAKYYEYGYEEM